MAARVIFLLVVYAPKSTYLRPDMHCLDSQVNQSQKASTTNILTLNSKYLKPGIIHNVPSIHLFIFPQKIKPQAIASILILKVIYLMRFPLIFSIQTN